MSSSLDTRTAGHSKPKHTLETLRPILIKLTLSCSVPIPAHATEASIPTPSVKPTGPPLSSKELHTLFSHLADPEFTANSAHHAQIGATLTSLRMSGWDMSSEALTIASRIFLDKAVPVHVPDLSKEEIVGEEWTELLKHDEGYVGALDLVGTGGDGHDTFNVSTTAAIVAAGVPVVRVCKHGARASSSTSGSADLLAALGVPLANLTPNTLPRIITRSPFTFLFAQLYHPALAPLAPIRRSLGFPSIFNVLGPLMNPSRPKRSIIGVHSWGLGQTFAEALRDGKCERAWVVCGREGLDEISPEGETDVWELRNGVITHKVISPASFGLDPRPLSQVKSGTAEENANVARYLFETSTHMAPVPKGALPKPLDFTSHNGKVYTIAAGTHLDALLDYVLLQSASLLYVAGKAQSLPEAVSLARASLRLGGAANAIDTLCAEAEQAGREIEVQQHQRDERELRKINRRDELYYTRDRGVGTRENGAGMHEAGIDMRDTTDTERE